MPQLARLRVGVELHGPAPGAVLGQPAAAGGDDQPAAAALGRLQPVVAEREVGGQLAVDVPHLAVLADDLGLVDLQRVAGAGDDRRPVLEVGRGRADHLPQPVDGGLARPRAPRRARPASSRRCPTRRWSVSVSPADPRRGGGSPQRQGRGRARFVADATAGSSGHGWRG